MRQRGLIFVPVPVTTPVAGWDRGGRICKQITQISPLPKFEQCLFWMMDGCRETSHQSWATFGPQRPEMTDSKVKGKEMKKSREENINNSFIFHSWKPTYLWSFLSFFLNKYWLNTVLIMAVVVFTSVCERPWLRSYKTNCPSEIMRPDNPVFL